MEERVKRASRGMNVLFYAQFIGLLSLFDAWWLTYLAFFALVVMNLWGLHMAAPAHRSFRLAYRISWLWLIFGLLMVLLPVLVYVSSAAAIVVYLVIQILSQGLELVQYLVEILILRGVEGLLREVGRERDARNAAVCWKGLAAVLLCGLLLLVALLLPISKALPNAVWMGVLPVVGLVALGLSIFYIVILYKGRKALETLDTVADGTPEAAGGADERECSPKEDPWD